MEKRETEIMTIEEFKEQVIFSIDIMWSVLQSMETRMKMTYQYEDLFDKYSELNAKIDNMEPLQYPTMEAYILDLEKTNESIDKVTEGLGYLQNQIQFLSEHIDTCFAEGIELFGKDTDA